MKSPFQATNVQKGGGAKHGPIVCFTTTRTEIFLGKSRLDCHFSVLFGSTDMHDSRFWFGLVLIDD